MNTGSFIRMMTLHWEVTFLGNLLALIKSVPIVVGQITCILMSSTRLISLLKFGSSRELLIWRKNTLLLAKASQKIPTSKYKCRWSFLIYLKIRSNRSLNATFNVLSVNNKYPAKSHCLKNICNFPCWHFYIIYLREQYQQ